MPLAVPLAVGLAGSVDTSLMAAALAAESLDMYLYGSVSCRGDLDSES